VRTTVGTGCSALFANSRTLRPDASVSVYTNTMSGDVETMTHPGLWIRQARLSLGISTRELARLADVSYPTVSKIEQGHEQPRWDTLTRLLRALGLSLTTTKPEPIAMLRLADLHRAWSTDGQGNHEPDWTLLRAFADWIQRFPELTAAAIAEAPRRSGSPFIDCLLAAVAETCAESAGLRHPAWTKLRPALATPWERLGTPKMRLRSRRNAPPSFIRRNIFIDQAAIWRTPRVNASASSSQRRRRSPTRHRTR
jgi:transcriptional regulator with XRE-family HTH domain